MKRLWSLLFLPLCVYSDQGLPWHHSNQTDSSIKPTQEAPVSSYCVKHFCSFDTGDVSLEPVESCPNNPQTNSSFFLFTERPSDNGPSLSFLTWDMNRH